jgi:hypothetical protein
MADLRVVIIGCGPSGMVIAHAAHQMGVPFNIYAPKKPSFISGAQYLHSDIQVRAEGIAPRTVYYKQRGVSWNYEQKIYGRLPEGLQTSWGKFDEEVEAWPLIDIYHWLWDHYSFAISDTSVTLDWMANAAMLDDVILFSTAPLRGLLPQYKYLTEKVQIVNNVCFAPEDTIVYNGELGCPWYRSSNLWGHMSVEYPAHAEVPREVAQYGLVSVEKPLMTNAVLPPGVIASGRYGRWEKGVLVDESYHQAITVIKARL